MHLNPTHDRRCRDIGRGRTLIEWAPVKSIWTGGMLLAALLLGPAFATPSAVALFAVTTVVTLCAGHSVGMHRLLVHRSFSARRWVEYGLVYLGTLCGDGGPDRDGAAA